VVQAAEAGVDVFVEKPMATDVAGCRAMIAAAKEHGIQLMVGQVLRYYEPYRSILRWRAAGRYGDLYAASIWRILDSRRLVDVDWRARRAQSGGYLFEVGAHELDMLRCLLGRPQTVHALSRKVLPRTHELADYIAVQIHFCQGGAATYESGGGSRVRRYGFRLYFEGATLTSDAAFDRNALRVYDEEGQEIEVAADEFSPEHPVEAELRGWLAALRDEAPIPISGEEGMATVALAEAAYRSAESGQIVAYEDGR
jgi:predicted dehydrogenase